MSKLKSLVESYNPQVLLEAINTLEKNYKRESKNKKKQVVIASNN